MRSGYDPENISRLPNRLITEKSPYLLQHAYNPVDWHPWGREAFEEALRENKPVFLSIGYSTCHWCHVMEKESFEDAEVAALMNEAFVPVKVDREERPDIDRIYMNVCQLMTGGGGWPLTIIMTPERRPFFAGTYFPRESHPGRIGMLDLVPRVMKIWKDQNEDAVKLSHQIADALKGQEADRAGSGPDEAVLHAAYEELSGRFDEQNGGFGPAPKFPTPQNLLFLLRYWYRTDGPRALEMVEHTLQAMSNGGIYDHIGGGFHRYSTDGRWLVPHFEKMLYDQALLAIACTEAYLATKKELYRETACEVLDYVLRDMTDPGGGFYSAEDADSEGEEGKFYVWSHEEIISVLGPSEAGLFLRVFNILREGNFTDQVTGGRPGTNILHRSSSYEQAAAAEQIPVEDLRDLMASALGKLRAVREKRVRPHRDDKILTDWNGLMIAAFARSARAFGRPEYAAAAKRAAAFIRGHLCTPEGRLLHRYRDGEASIPAYADDYAFLIAGLTELYETVFDVTCLEDALSLNRVFIEHFWDSDRGGFYFTADDAEEMLVRNKEGHDAAVPSGNSIAMLNLLRLGRMTGDPGLEEKAMQLWAAFSASIREYPTAYAQMLLAAAFALGPSCEVIIAGDSEAEETKSMLNALQSRFLPGAVALLRRTEQQIPDIDRIAGLSDYHAGPRGQAMAYICVNRTCQLPTSDISEMLELLDRRGNAG